MISRPVRRAVLFVCRNREDLAWISAFKLDCSYLQSLSLSASPPLEKPRTYLSVSVSACYRAFLLPSGARVRARFFSTFFSLPSILHVFFFFFATVYV